MYVCVYARVSVCVCVTCHYSAATRPIQYNTHSHTCTHKHTHALTHTHMYPHTYTRTHTHTHACVYTNMHTLHTHTQKHTHTHAPTRIHVYTHMHILPYTHSHLEMQSEHPEACNMHTPRSRDDETRTARRNTNRNPRWAKVHSFFQMSRSKRDLG